MALRCPACGKAQLTEKTVTKAGAKVDLCSTCYGTWFDGCELESVSSVAVKHLAPPPTAEASERLCPRCEKPMSCFNYPQTLVTVDMCRKCRGIWLDGSELREIVTVREGLKKSGAPLDAGEPGGVKGALIHLIDQAIDELKFW